MRIAAIAIVALCAVAPAVAEEVLYCADTDANGFKWDRQGNIERAGFKPGRFTVKVISETERMISWPEIDKPVQSRCSKFSEKYHCIPVTGALLLPIIFDSKGYIRARITRGSQIAVAYGTCTKF